MLYISWLELICLVGFFSFVFLLTGFVISEIRILGKENYRLDELLEEYEILNDTIIDLFLISIGFNPTDLLLDKDFDSIEEIDLSKYDSGELEA